VVETGKTYVNPRTGGSITISEHWDDNGDRRLGFERTMVRRTGRLDPHLHLDCSQAWTAISGELRMEVDGSERALAPDSRVELEAGAAHRDPWNVGDGDAVVRAEVEPVPEFFKAYTEAYVNRLLAGKLNRHDEFPLLQIFVLVAATDGRSYRAGIPLWLQRPLIPAAAAIGRLAGYRASYDG
jgi:mannose-6-phosphate isomerase-like protein (cupin superfamily)